MQGTMNGVVLPGNSTVAYRQQAIPTPGPGQVLIQMKASSICGSDIRAIYREHTGVGDEGYRNVIAGHEPCGVIVETGPGCKERKVGDRVVLYHISGCGNCEDCRAGYMISCHSENGHRAAYGWQRDGGHAPYMLAEENTCIPLPENLTYLDGALVACGFGTAWEALTRMRVDGRDRLLITGLGPVGLAAAMLGKALGVAQVIGVDSNPGRIALAQELGLVDTTLSASDDALTRILDATGGKGCEASIDCSGASPARLLALKGTRQWGRCAFVGEGGTVSFDVSPVLIHQQITLFGSWVTSLGHMAELLERLSRWEIHPDKVVTHKFPVEKAAEAYDTADKGIGGKVAIVFE
ncbi:MAG: zinc-binding dehydrogenase [Fibrella sp.]|nr:zinc-binding dehydrogenase [Armatimonadota bacterium]